MTRTDKLSSTNRAKKFVKHLWRGKADKQSNQSVVPSPVNSGLTLVASATTQSTQPKPSTPSSPSPSQKGPGGLWDKAYQLVEQEDSELLACYEKYILSTAGQSRVLSAEERAAELRKFASQRLKAVQEGDLKVIIHGKEIVVKEQIDRVIRCILAVKDVVREVLDNDPHGALAWAGIVVILPFLVNPLTQSDDAAQLVSYISDLLVRMRVIEVTRSHIASDGISSEIFERLGKKIVDLYAQVIRSQMRIACQYSRSSFLRFWRDVVQVDDWQQSLTDLKDGKESIDEDLRVIGDHTLRQVDVKVSELHEKADKTIRMLNDISQDLIISKLPIAKFAGFNAFDPSLRVPSTTCLENTRTEILKDIEDWGLESDENCIFWLSGMAGTGKSTISRTIAERFHKRKLLGASFFFSRTGELRNQATALFPTLASQLTDTIPELRPYVKDVIDQDRSIGEQPPQSQWQHLVLGPLSQLDKNLLLPLNVVIVIDALDECRDHDRHDIMGLFSQTRGLNMIHIRTMIVSRPERFIVQGFQKLEAPSQNFTLRECKLDSDEQSPHTTRDVTIFLNAQLSALAIKHEFDPEWPGEDVKQTLVKRTGRLFIYAATVCRFLDGVFPEDKLEALLSTNPEDESPMADLDEVYQLVLRRNITESTDKKTLVNLFQRIVGSIILLNETLSQQSLAMLLDIPLKRVYPLLDMLRSVLVVPQDKHDTSPISLFHLSFHDFLLDTARCSDPNFCIDEKFSHERIFDSCLKTMDRHLMKNICKLHHPGILHEDIESSLVDLRIPPELQYSCVYWVTHLVDSKFLEIPDGRLYKFLTIHFLHWLEALSLVEKFSEGLGSLIRLEETVKSDKEMFLQQFVYDARRFAFHVRSTAEETPLQIYISGLIFAPHGSLVRMAFQHEIPAWFKKLPVVDEHWTPIEQVIEQPTSSSLVTISSDGKMIASAPSNDWDREIILYDTATGKEIARVEIKSRTRILALKFLENDTNLAIASDNGEIKLVVLSTGEEQTIFQSNTQYPEQTTRADFSLNHLAIVHLHWRNTNYLLNMKTFQATGFGYGLLDPVISPNGNFVAAKGPGVVHIWDVAKNVVEPIPTESLTSGSYHSHSDPRTMRFSSDSKILAFGFESGNISLWDLTSNKVYKHLDGGHDSPVTLIVFSHDDSKIISLDDNDVIKIWDLSSGRNVQIYQGVGAMPRSIDFLPGDHKVAASFNDKTIRIWNLDLDGNPSTEPREPCLISVSQDTSTAAVMFHDLYDNALELWNLRDNTKVKFETTDIQAVALSLDGTLLATGHENGIITLWEAPSAREIITFRAHKLCVYTLVFSHDGTKLVSANSGARSHREEHLEHSEIKIWDVRKLLADFVPTIDSEKVLDSRPIPWPATSSNFTVPEPGMILPEKEIVDGLPIELKYAALSPDQSRLAILYGPGRCTKVWDFSTDDTFEFEYEEPYGDGLSSLDFYSETILAVGFEFGVILYDLSSGQFLRELKQCWSSMRGLTSPVEAESAGAVFFFERNKSWLTRNGEQMLYLPSPYRFGNTGYMKGGTCCIQGNTVFLGTWEHEVLQLCFRPVFDQTI